MTNKQCCKPDDVRGMCFSRIGDLSNMTAKTIVEVKKCHRLPYAVGWWLNNNHEVYYHTLFDFWKKTPELTKYLDLLVDEDGQGMVYEALYELEMDKQNDDSDEE